MSDPTAPGDDVDPSPGVSRAVRVARSRLRLTSKRVVGANPPDGAHVRLSARRARRAGGEGGVTSRVDDPADR